MKEEGFECHRVDDIRSLLRLKLSKKNNFCAMIECSYGKRTGGR